MKTLALIGMGTITKQYAAGLQHMTAFRLCAVCDIAEKPAAREMFPHCPFYRDYRQMLAAEQPAYVMISTPPQTHYDIARYALSHGVSVLVEKPAVLRLEEYDALVQLARDKGLHFEVAFHWQGGSEVQRFGELYDPADITAVHVTIIDPYSADGVTIDGNKRNLMGAWVDSGVNALSMLRLWLPFARVTVESLEVQKCPESGLPLFADVRFSMDGIPVEITVDWRQGREDKHTRLTYRGREIVLNHSQQRIEDGDRVIDCYVMPRLAQHYYAYFAAYRDNPDAQAARDIHRVLLEVAARYEKTVS